MASVALFDMNLHQLKEQRDRQKELIKGELEEKRPDVTLIESCHKRIKYIDGLLEIKDPEIEGKAKSILEKGDPVGYIIGVYNRLHVGDTDLGKIMLISIANQCAATTDGTQPKLSGEPGKGKTHAVTAMYHLIPDVGYKIEGSLSAKILYYDQDLMPGTVIFADDVRIPDDLEDTLKRAMTNFQRETVHRTVDRQLQPRTLTIPPRTVFWMTSVSRPFSIELNSRLYEVNVDESPETDEAVTKQRMKRALKGDEALPEDEEVKICRAIIHAVRCKTFHVRIPYAEYINWYSSQNRRNLNRFLDLVQGFTVLRFMQRPEVEESGIHTILADIQDFEDAKVLYDATSKSQITKLTDSERRLAEWLSSKGPKTINKLVEEYLKTDGTQYKYNGIRKLIKGNEGRGGLLDKVPGMMVSKVNGEEAFELRKFDVGSVGSIVSLKSEAYEKYS